MANYSTLFSTLFPVGSATNVAPALALYRQLAAELEAAGETIGFEAEADDLPEVLVRGMGGGVTESEVCSMRARHMEGGQHGTGDQERGGTSHDSLRAEALPAGRRTGGRGKGGLPWRG